MQKLPNSLYSLHPAFDMMSKMEKTISDKTGKTIQEWVAILENFEGTKFKERQLFLKEKYGLGQNYAYTIIRWLEGERGAETYDPEALVEAQYAGAKSVLKPIYNFILDFALSLDPAVAACPAKGYVPIYRNNVIAHIKAATKSRIDLGLALRDTEASGVLIDTGGFNKGDRITHKIEITKLDDFDETAKSWLKKAFEMDC